MVKYTVKYFQARGRAEAIRTLLSYTGSDFEDEYIDFRTAWKEALLADGLSGLLPLICTSDGEKWTDSTSICRYIATLHRMIGRNAKEALKIDMAAATISDATSDCLPTFLVKDEAEKAQRIEALRKRCEEMLPFIERIITESGGPFLCGEYLSWAEFTMSEQLMSVEVHVPDLLEKFPKVKKMKQTYIELDKVKAFKDKTNADYVFPI